MNKFSIFEDERVVDAHQAAELLSEWPRVRITLGAPMIGHAASLSNFREAVRKTVLAQANNSNQLK